MTAAVGRCGCGSDSGRTRRCGCGSSRRTGRASCCLDYPTHHAGTLASTHTPKALPRVQRGWEQATRRARDGGMERTHGITTWYSHRRAQTGCSRCALVCVINPPCPPLTTMRLSDAPGRPSSAQPGQPAADRDGGHGPKTPRPPAALIARRTAELSNEALRLPSLDHPCRRLSSTPPAAWGSGRGHRPLDGQRCVSRARRGPRG